MLVIGTGGFASDILNTLTREMNRSDIVLYNDVDDLSEIAYKDQFRILRNREQAEDYFKNEDARFLVGIGDNKTREYITNEFLRLGGTNPSYISSNAYVNDRAIISPQGVIIMQYSSVSNTAQIDEGSIIYLNSGIGHNSHVKKYCMISASVFMSDVELGAYAMVGIGVSFKPGVKVGDNSIIGTGTIVTKTFGDNSILYGNPAILKTDKR